MKIFPSAFILLFAARVSGGTLTLDDAIRTAWAHDPAVAALADTPALARARELQAGSRPVPEIELRGGAPLGGDSEWFAGVGITQRLPRRDRVAQARAVARLGADVAAWHLQEQRRLVAGETRQLFYTALVQQARFDLARRATAEQRAFVEAAARRHALGEIADLDLALARLELTRSENALALAVAEHEAALEKLRSRLRLSETTAMVLDSTLAACVERTPPAPTAPTDVSRPELALARHAIREADAALALARTESRSDWTVGAGLDMERRANDATGQLETEPQLSVSASIPWPGRVANQGDIAEKQITLRHAEVQLAAAHEQLAAEINTACATVARLHPALTRLHTSLRETAAAPAALERGEISDFQRYQLRQLQRNAEADFIDAAERYVAALATAEALLGHIPSLQP